MPRLPHSRLPREFEEIDFVHPDGHVEVLEFDAGTPEPEIDAALRRYTEEVSGQRAVPPVSEVGRVTAAQGALTDLNRAKSGVTPAPAPLFEGLNDPLGKAWEYIKYAIGTPSRGMEDLQTPEGIAKARGEYADLINAPSRGLGIALSGGMEDLGAADRGAASRALEEGTANAASFVPAAIGSIADLMRTGAANQIHGIDPGPNLAQGFYDTSMDIKSAADAIPIEGPRSVFEIDSPEAMGQWLENTLAEQAPIMAGLIGAGTLMGPAGILPASMGMETGIITQQQLQANGEADPRMAAVGGVIAGALEAAPIMHWLKRTSMGDDAMRWIGDRARSMLIQTGEEMPTEYAQELVEALATQFVAGNKDQFSGREWEEALRVVKETQPQAIGAAAAAGVIAPLMGGLGGQGGQVDTQALLQEVLAEKTKEQQWVGRVAQEAVHPPTPTRGIQDIIAATLAQQQPAPQPALVPEGDQGPRIPPVEPVPPIEQAPPAAQPPPAQPPEQPPQPDLSGLSDAEIEQEIAGAENTIETGVTAEIQAGASQYLDDLNAEAVRREQEPAAPKDRRAPTRAEIPKGIRGDEAARLKQLLREGKVEEAGTFSDEIVRRAETDTLTGLRNQGAHQRAVDEAPEGSSHAYIDLDDFKQLNDAYGHDIGDKMLAEAADIIADETGKIDGFEGFRRGGDEFAILAGANQNQLEGVAERIRQRISDAEIAVDLPNGTTGIGKVGASYGIGQTLEEADKALYKDKGTKAQRRAESKPNEPTAGRDNAGVDQARAEGVPQREVPTGTEEEVKGPRPASELPEYAHRAILEEGAARRTNEGGSLAAPDPYADSLWSERTIDIESLREKNPSYWSGNFVPRGSRTKGPIVVDNRGIVLDGNNRVFEAIQRGDASIDAFVEESVEPEADLPEPLPEPTEADIAKLARLWQTAIVDNPVDVLRDETERDDFVQEIIDTLADPDDTKTEALGRQLAEMPERDLIQIAKDAYEGKEARANLPLPFLEKVKRKAKEKKKAAKEAKEAPVTPPKAGPPITSEPSKAEEAAPVPVAPAPSGAEPKPPPEVVGAEVKKGTLTTETARVPDFTLTDELIEAEARAERSGSRLLIKFPSGRPPSPELKTKMKAAAIKWDRPERSYVAPPDTGAVDIWTELNDSQESRAPVAEKRGGGGTMGRPSEQGFPHRPLDALDPEYSPYFTPRRAEPPPGKVATTTAPAVIKKAVKVAEELGMQVPVRVGVKGKKRAGFFKVRPEVIRIKTANDVETVIHELGHAIEKAVFGWVKGSPWTPPLATKARQNELLRLGKALYGDKVPAGRYKREGWAEFWRLWNSQPENAKKHAPEFTKWFEDEFLVKQSAAARKAMTESQAEHLKWFEQGSVNRVKAAMVDTQAAKARLAKAWQKAKELASPEYTYEMLHPLHEIARAAEEQLGRELKPSEDPYFIGSALRKTHYARVAEMVNHQMIDFNGNPVGPPLSDVNDLVKGQYDDFWTYMYAKRASALWTDPNRPEGRNPGITLNDANEVIKELETANFMAAARKVYRWTDQTLDYAAQASPAFEAIVDKIREVDPGYYIPLQRVFDEMTKRYSGGGRGSVAKRLRGSGRQIKDPLQTLVAQTSRLVRAAHQERIIEALIKLEGVEGMGQFIERIPVDKIPVKTLTIGDMLNRINKQLEWEGASVEGQGYFDPSMLDQAITFFSPAQKAPNGKRIIVRYDPDSKQPIWYEVNEDLYEMFETMEPYRLPAVGEWLAGKPTALKRAGTVGLRASFQLVWNMIRDPQTMYLQTQTKAWAPRLLWTWADSMKDAFLYRLTGRRTPALDVFVRTGLEMVQPLAQDINYTRRTARRMHQGRVVVVLDPHNWFDLFRDMIQFPELAPRITELKLLAKDHGIDLTKPLSEDEVYFLMLAPKQVTTDFTSESKFSRVMTRIVPFFNAQIQGPRATGRAFRRNPKKFMGRALQMGVLTVALWLLNRDEDWYRETPWRERFLHWQFATDWPEPTIIRLPRAFEIGILFAALPEAALDTWYTKDPEAATAWAETFVQTLNPGVMPVLMEEAVAQAKNEDLFWRTPIVPQGELRRPQEEQYNEYTTRAAIKLGDWFNVSPRRIDHAIKGVAGTVPRDLLQVLGVGTKEMDRGKTIADLPVVGRMFRREGKMGSYSRSVNKIYDLHEEAVITGNSKKHPETEEQRQRRLMLGDATDALSALSYVRRFTHSIVKRQKIQRLRVDIAREALKAAELPATEAVREYFKTRKKKAEAMELRSEVEGGRAGEPKNRSDAIRQALIKDPETNPGDLYRSLEDASFSRGRSRKDFQKRFYQIKIAMGTTEQENGGD